MNFFLLVLIVQTPLRSASIMCLSVSVTTDAPSSRAVMNPNLSCHRDISRTRPQAVPKWPWCCSHNTAWTSFKNAAPSLIGHPLMPHFTVTVLSEAQQPLSQDYCSLSDMQYVVRSCWWLQYPHHIIAYNPMTFGEATAERLELGGVVRVRWHDLLFHTKPWQNG